MSEPVSTMEQNSLIDLTFISILCNTKGHNCNLRTDGNIAKLHQRYRHKVVIVFENNVAW